MLFQSPISLLWLFFCRQAKVYPSQSRELTHRIAFELWRTTAFIYVVTLALWTWMLMHNTKETYLSVFPIIFWCSIIHWKSVNTICTCIPHSLTIQIFQSSFWGYVIKSIGPLRHRRVIITIGWIKTSMNIRIILVNGTQLWQFSKSFLKDYLDGNLHKTARFFWQKLWPKLLPKISQICDLVLCCNFGK